MQLVFVLCLPVSSIPTSLSFFKSFCPCNINTQHNIMLYRCKCELEKGRTAEYVLGVIFGIASVVVTGSIIIFIGIEFW